MSPPPRPSGIAQTIGTLKATVVPVPPVGAVIIHGYGAELGDFAVFAEHLKNDLAKTYLPKHIFIQHIEEKQIFLDYLKANAFGVQIRELHVFSHSYGAALALGYHSVESQTRRSDMYARSIGMGRDATYDEVISTEKGNLFTDDLLNIPDPTPYRAFLDKSSKTFIKLWGCLAGVDGWEFSDDYEDSSGRWVTPPHRYWRMLNTRHFPKRAIAREIARFFGVKVKAAKTGSHVEVFDRGHWISTSKYKKLHGRAPSGVLKHRLHPDEGDYEDFIEP